ncbi:hypothetical protein [Ferrovibrio sp.]|uniref:hypothetical protein n=1 Tax=Ferrovibrio sp. TaxID=1917215 RepID=UPI002611A9C2|nr:hypothetical protein [Ferrovibrio sp.]
MSTDIAGRFREVITRKLLDVAEVYDALEARPDTPGDDKALALRHATGRTVLTHLALLRKLLAQEDDVGPEASPGIDLDMDSYRAMVAALNEAEHG